MQGLVESGEKLIKIIDLLRRVINIDFRPRQSPRAKIKTMSHWRSFLNTTATPLQIRRRRYYCSLRRLLTK